MKNMAGSWRMLLPLSLILMLLPRLSEGQSYNPPSYYPRLGRSEKVDKAFAFTADFIPRNLRGDCIERIGDFNLVQFGKQITGLKVAVTNVFFIGSGRRDGVSVVTIQGQRYVLLLPYVYNSAAREVKPVFALHEGLRWAGYLDENYELSVGMWFLSQQTPERRKELLASRAFRSFRNVRELTGDPAYPGMVMVPFRKKKLSGYEFQVASGRSSVGGGGNPDAIHAKMLMMDEAEAWRAKYVKAHPREKVMSLEDLYDRILISRVEKSEVRGNTQYENISRIGLQVFHVDDRDPLEPIFEVPHLEDYTPMENDQMADKILTRLIHLPRVTEAPPRRYQPLVPKRPAPSEPEFDPGWGGD